ncbi:hypothetical protein ACED66_14535 [Vibrio splendidus]|uniref:hypothetical protein n=1 Tax=Vibrio splendidus TaxID=29497 RepID=UPI000D3B3FE5|nr:hypothetical protein [Vibrio splendidus]MDH5897698.1 hypothetical protein [Vibrio splendidus]PTQ08330.1 hypothetical protein CWO28_06155 [Vibrio splendidus]
MRKKQHDRTFEISHEEMSTLSREKVKGYSDFDAISSKELSEPISVNEIVSHGIFFPTYKYLKEFTENKKFIRENPVNLLDKMGVYLLWEEYCVDSEGRKLLECVYVGKGWADERVNEHLREKIESSKTFVTFYECLNRLAKYLEQLFLDLYDFEINKAEKSGSKTLFMMVESELAYAGNARFQEESIALFHKKHEKSIERSLAQFSEEDYDDCLKLLNSQTSKRSGSHSS